MLSLRRERLGIFAYSDLGSEGLVHSAYYAIAERWGRLEHPSGSARTVGSQVTHEVEAIAHLPADTEVPPSGMILAPDGRRYRILAVLSRTAMRELLVRCSYTDDAVLQLLFPGEATITQTNAIDAIGGQTFRGDATLEQVAEIAGSGGLAFVGDATIEQLGSALEASGGIEFRGAIEVATAVAIEGAAGLTFAGALTATTLASITAAGGLTFRGDAQLQAPAIITAAGGQTFEALSEYQLLSEFGGPMSMTQPGPGLAASGDNGVFLSWDLGEDLAAAGLTFTGPAGRTYFDENGILQTAGANVFRTDSWHRTESGVWMRVGLLEMGSSNLLPRMAPTKAQVAAGSGITDASGKDGVGGFAKWLQFPAGASTETAYQSATISATTQYTISAVVEMDDGSVPSIGTTTSLGDFGFVVGTSLVGATGSFRISRLGTTNRYLCSATITTAASPSNQHGIVRYNTMSGKAFTVTGIQLEPGPIATSRINAVGTPLSRAAEVLSFAYSSGMPATGIAALIDCVDLGSSALITPSPVYASLGNGLPSAKLFGGSGLISAIYFNSASQQSAANINPGIVPGRRVTGRMVVAGGRATLGYSGNGGAEQVSVAAAAVAADATIAANVFYINGVSSQTGRIGLLSARLARGDKSQANLLSF